MKSPTDPDVVRLRPWRASCRPAQCKRRGKPCWVDDPYAAMGHNAYYSCVTCGGSIPALDVRKFMEFTLSLKDPVT